MNQVPYSDVCVHVERSFGFFETKCLVDKKSRITLIDFPSREGKDCPRCGRKIRHKLKFTEEK